MEKMVDSNSLLEFYKEKKVLITGHTGFKGSWLTLLLNSIGAQVIGYALKPNTEPSLYNLAKIYEIHTSIYDDIRNYKNFFNVIKKNKPEIVIHMAAQPLVRESYSNPVETYEINTMGTVNLFEAIRNTDGVKVVVNVTTDKCYENNEWHWGYREYEPMGGFDPYSNSKACSELITSSFRNSFFNENSFNKHGVAIATARAGNVIGGGDWADDRLIPDFIRSALQKKKIKIRNPHAIRPWQHVMEPLWGYLILAMKLYNEGTKYNGGWNFGPDDSDAKDVLWIVQKLCDLWTGNVSYEIDKSLHPHEANYLKLDCSKAKSELKWQPRWNVENSITKIVEWYKVFEKGGNIREITLKQINDYF